MNLKRNLLKHSACFGTIIHKDCFETESLKQLSLLLETPETSLESIFTDSVLNITSDYEVKEDSVIIYGKYKRKSLSRKALKSECLNC